MHNLGWPTSPYRSRGKSLKRSWALSGMLWVAGCATSPAPNFYNGAYYMAGDASCVHLQAISPTRVMCQNAKGQQTGYRDAMTDQQLMMYQQIQLQQQMIEQYQAVTLAANNQAMAAPTAMRYPQMSMPQVNRFRRGRSCRQKDLRRGVRRVGRWPSRATRQLVTISPLVASRMSACASRKPAL